MLTTEELIGYRARALAKHQQHVLDLQRRVDKGKRAWAKRYEKEHLHTIKDYKFKPRDLVLMRNTSIEDHLNKKLKPRWLGPLIVIKQVSGGSYLLAEMDGSVLHKKVAKIRVIPYFARQKLMLTEEIMHLIELSEEGLKKLEESTEPENDIEPDPAKDLWFDGVNLKDNYDKRLSEEDKTDDRDNLPLSEEEIASESDRSSEDDIRKRLRPWRKPAR